LSSLIDVSFCKAYTDDYRFFIFWKNLLISSLYTNTISSLVFSNCFFAGKFCLKHSTIVIFSNELYASMYPFRYSKLNGWLMKMGISEKASKVSCVDQYKLPSFEAMK
jgi:hypothetical protein